MTRLSLPVLLCAVLAGVAFAQAAPPSARSAIATAASEAKEAAERARGFEKAAAEARNAADRARAEAEALIAAIDTSEAEITAAEARVRMIEAEIAERQERLAERQRPVVQLTAALQTMARRPPALALVQPGTVDEAARVRALLGATLPAIRERTAGLRAELDEAAELRARGGEALQALAARRQELRRKRVALARLEESQRRRSGALIRSALGEGDRSIALAEEGRELAAAIPARAFEARLLKELASLPPPLPRPHGATPPPPKKDPPAYRLPLEGELVTGFGEISDSGIHSRGVIVRPASALPVVAPRGGRIAYAGGFRSYGQIVIIDHGGGWTTTITNLAALRVARGDAVTAGTPLGRAAADSEVGVELRRHGTPQPIAWFL
ncbi:MAG TPA: peptidoglycan DD-metalloendopeptidase family protein [Allosphingosinicella sp.]|nr:peptidoglycan DD-metalloendopeptidase family protein [Allosphingosinicella sp.]